MKTKKESKVIRVLVDESINSFIESIITSEKKITYYKVIQLIIKFYYDIASTNDNRIKHLIENFKKEINILDIKNVFLAHTKLNKQGIIIKKINVRINKKHHDYISNYSDIYMIPMTEVVYSILKQFIIDYKNIKD